MRLLLTPLFDAELPPSFEDVILQKLRGKEVRTGETVEIDLLGKSLPFKVLLAEPSPMKVQNNVRVEISTSPLTILDFEFEEPLDDVIPFERGFVLVLKNKVLILNQEGQKIYSDEFEELNGVRVSKNTVVIIHGRNKIRLIKP
ncbi:DUF6849 domain-containing protein [Thermococcus sp.]